MRIPLSSLNLIRIQKTYFVNIFLDKNRQLYLLIPACTMHNYIRFKKGGVQEDIYYFFSHHISFCDLHPILLIAFFFAAPTHKRFHESQSFIESFIYSAPSYSLLKSRSTQQIRTAETLNRCIFSIRACTIALFLDR
jgi:hypothetical protein